MFKVGDKVKYTGKSFGELKGEVARRSNCAHFGHIKCKEELLSLTDSPGFFYHARNFVLITDD